MGMAVTITVVTAAIMSTDRGLSESRLAGGLALVMGLAMLAMALPRMQGYFHVARMPAGIEESLKSGSDIPDDKLAEAIGLLQEARAALPDDATLSDRLSRLYLRVAAREALRGGDEKVALAHAIALNARTLENAPSRGFDWSLAALLRSKALEPWEVIEPFWRNSLYLAPYEASSILIRTRLAGLYWAHLPEDLQRGATQDFIHLWQIPPLRRDFIATYIGAPLALKVVIYREALVSEADHLLFKRLVTAAIK